jgi:hypothetical protein
MPGTKALATPLDTTTRHAAAKGFHVCTLSREPKDERRGSQRHAVARFLSTGITEKVTDVAGEALKDAVCRYAISDEDVLRNLRTRLLRKLPSQGQSR